MRANDLIQERYRLDEMLGQGGMAAVWKAHDERLDRPVAIKLLAPRFLDDPEFLVRFFGEAQLVGRLSHPNVVPVLDFGEHDGRPYLVMEYLPRGSAADLTGTPLLPERAIEIVRDAAAGAGAAHAAGLVHRDIKPGNILIGAGGEAKLADFGIASSSGGERLTATGQAIGSPHYISPEQASGHPLGPSSDVYALGVVLYELLTGKRPFDGDNITAIAIAHVHKSPVPPSAHIGELDPAIERIVMRCLAKDPETRFTDGAALARALDDPSAALVQARPGVAPTVDGWEVVEGSATRRRAVVAAIAGVAAVGLLAAAVYGSTRSAEPDRPLTRNEEVEPRGADAKQVRRDVVESPSPSQAPVVVSSPSTSPSPSSSPTEDRDGPRPRPRADEDDDEPAPEPTVEPTASPVPTVEPEPTTSPTEGEVETGLPDGSSPPAEAP